MKHIFLTFLISSISLVSFSQKIEIGACIGGSLFSGDVNPDFALRETKPALNISFKYYISNKLGIKSSLLYTTVSGDDFKNMSLSEREISKKFRNLSFRSRIIEFNVVAEYLFRDLLVKKSAPYVFAGIGMFYFNPKAKFNGEWHELQPLGTEGQGLPGYGDRYKRLQPCVLAGIGYKYKISSCIHLGFEIGLRLTNTDYIDDVSKEYVDKNTLKANGDMAVILSDRFGEVPEIDMTTYVASNKSYFTNNPGDPRGNSKNKDKYLIYSLTFSYRFLNPSPNPTNFLK